MGRRTTEFVLGLIAGILGFFAAVFALAVGTAGSALGAEGAGDIVGLGWAAMGFSVLGIIGSVVVKRNDKWGGGLLLIAGIGGLISISFFYILSFVLFLIAGLLALFKKDEEADQPEPAAGVQFKAAPAERDPLDEAQR